MRDFQKLFLILFVCAGSMCVYASGNRISKVEAAGTLTCPPNPDNRYSRNAVLEQFAKALNDSVRPTMPIKVTGDIAEGFFVYDLADTSNNTLDLPCIELIEDHVYHFSPTLIPDSLSHIAILRNGKAMIFGPVNCRGGVDALRRAISFVEEHDRYRKDDTVTRLHNYRRYGWYWTIDQFKPGCRLDPLPPRNPDPALERRDILLKLRDSLARIATEAIEKRFPVISVEGDQAIGFFVYDLSEPSNRQTSLTEYVDFKEGHVYHFAYIDLPYSFSNIAVIKEGKLKLFRAINCSGSGDSVNDVVKYLKRFGKNNGNSDLVERVRSYRQYGVYAEFDGRSAPQCSEFRSRNRKRQMS